jgi:hypothetical protein
MLVIRTVSGVEMRVPIDQLDSITQVEPGSGSERPTPRHPYLHREGAARLTVGLPALTGGPQSPYR